jgi:nicotinate-nucleotide adenylyltransferase
MIGIFGGTFNPIHKGHLRAAEEVVAALGLSKMLFVPSARPPHKDERDGVIAPASDRLAWTELAVADNPLFEVDAVEMKRPGPSYLVDTLEDLRGRFGEELVFVAGRDAFREMGSWRSPRSIFAACHVVVTSRPPETAGQLSEWLPESVRDDFDLAPDGFSGEHKSARTWIRQLEITALDISATAIRERLAQGASIRHLVPDSAHAAIVASKCYKKPSGSVAPGPS